MIHFISIFLTSKEIYKAIFELSYSISDSLKVLNELIVVWTFRYLAKLDSELGYCSIQFGFSGNGGKTRGKNFSRLTEMSTLLHCSLGTLSVNVLNNSAVRKKSIKT